LGGVTEIIGIIFGFFLFPVSYHSFILKAAQHMFFARTTDNTIFRESKKDQTERDKQTKEIQNYDAEVKEELGTHKKIRIKCIDNLVLFFSQNMPYDCFKCKKFGKNVKL